MFRIVFGSIFCLLVFSGEIVLAQSSPASGPLPAKAAPGDEIALADYLALLKQIAPAAEEGARNWLAAVRLRCARDVTPEALRRAISADNGDPVLMDFIRAAARQDSAARNALVARIDCGAPR
ncbi:MAG: hypothetical protein LBI92_05855 [Azoarcus sp.]|jgi:hypothetical protein|nr:hypothetical protein [Azoarcus sp.]